jgi:hypothetical protein
VPLLIPSVAQWNQPGNVDEPGGGVFTAWTQGALVEITDSGVLPAQPAAGYPVTVTFRNAAGTTVYTITTPLKVPAEAQASDGTDISSAAASDNVNVGASAATGASSCVAVEAS